MTAFIVSVKLDPKQFKYWIKLASVLQLNHQYESAVKAYKSACEINSELKKVWKGLGYCYYKLGQNEKAIESFDCSLKLQKKENTELKQKIDLEDAKSIKLREIFLKILGG
jgi:tetratricopeptide (TPR) repeat protein